MFSSVQDDNFCFPIPNGLETEKLKLVPFIPSLHAEAIIDATDNDTWHYLPFGPYASAQDFIDRHYEALIRPDSANTYFVSLDKTKLNSNGEPTPAGLAGYLYTNPDDLWTELFVLVLPQFQRTHVASHMIGLLLQYALNLSTHTTKGLGLRRVQWHANVENKGSIGLAMKMGFKMEGVQRWARVLQPGKEDGSNGRSTRKGDPREECKGRDSASLAICWDDWEEEGKQRVEEILRR